MIRGVIKISAAGRKSGGKSGISYMRQQFSGIGMTLCAGTMRRHVCRRGKQVEIIMI